MEKKQTSRKLRRSTSILAVIASIAAMLSILMRVVELSQKELILGLSGALLGLLLGYYFYNMKWRIRMWWLARELGKALRMGNSQQIKELAFSLQVLKLYSPDPIHQGTAITYLAEFGDQRSFEVLAARLGSKPDLVASNKALLISTLKDLLYRLQNDSK